MSKCALSLVLLVVLGRWGSWLLDEETSAVLDAGLQAGVLALIWMGLFLHFPDPATMCILVTIPQRVCDLTITHTFLGYILKLLGVFFDTAYVCLLKPVSCRLCLALHGFCLYVGSLAQKSFEMFVGIF